MDILRVVKDSIFVNLASHEDFEELFLGSQVNAFKSNCEHEGRVALICIERGAQTRLQSGSVFDSRAVNGLFAEIEKDDNEENHDDD